MKKAFTLFMVMVVALTTAFAKEVSYDFSNSIPKGWTSSVNPNGYETTSRGSQFTASAVLTLKGVTNATKVVITCSANTDKNSMAVAVDGKAFGQTITLAKENDVNKTFSGEAATGDLTVTLTRAEKSIYIKTIVVTCDEVEGGNDDGGNDDGGNGGNTNKLDPNYTYAEPTTIQTTNLNSSNQPYSFVQNNILVECTSGASTAGYFGCNAGCKITFTATQEIVAVAVNGYVKAGFDAEASAGDLYFACDEEEAVEQNPVLYIEDIKAKSVTINCLKQLRCYSVKFYFKEAPKLDLDDLFGGNDDDWGSFTYEYEPTEKKVINIEFDEAYYESYMEEGDTISVGDYYFVNDDFEMELYIYAALEDLSAADEIVLPIDTLYAKNHVAASIGYNALLGDMPSVVYTDFFQEDGDWYYETSYYLVSGTVTFSKKNGVTINATSYNGSTINATFKGTFQVEETAISELKSEEKKSNGKYMQNNQLFLQHNGRRYNAAGLLSK